MNDALWTSDAAGTATGGELRGAWSCTGVSIDTRTLASGDLFVALKDVRDGHDFVDAAFKAGAAAALVSRDVLNGRPGLVVPDVLAALEALGLAARARTNATCAAVTGSVGKTSVKEMLARIFRAAGPAHWSDKSFNNHWGVPLTLARMPAATQRAIFEIGMNTPGEIAPRSRMVRPHVAMITRIAAAHLQGMGSIEAVADEKSQIFAGLESGGAVILPAKDQFFDRLKRTAQELQPTAQVFSFGVAGQPRPSVPLDYATDGASSRIRIDVMGDVVDVSLYAVGAHWADNAALAVLAATLCGLSAREAAEALSGYAPPAGRGVAERIALPGCGDITLVDDSYNANPESMRAALGGFAQRPGRRIVALGEMRELGPDADELHAELAGPIVAAGVAIAVLSGAGMAPLAAELQKRNGALRVVHASGPEEASDVVKSLLEPGDAVLIKGSNTSGMSQLGAALRKMAEDAAQAQKATGVSDAV